MGQYPRHIPRAVEYKQINLQIMDEVTIGARVHTKSSIKKSFRNFRVLNKVGVPISDVEVIGYVDSRSDGTPLVLMEGKGNDKKPWKDANGKTVPQCFITLKAQTQEQEANMKQHLADGELLKAYNQKITMNMPPEAGKNAFAKGFGTLKLDSKVRDDGSLSVYPSRFIPADGMSVTRFATSDVDGEPVLIELHGASNSPTKQLTKNGEGVVKKK